METNYETRKRKKFVCDSIREWCEDRYFANNGDDHKTIGQASRRFSNISIVDLMKIFPPKNNETKKYRAGYLNRVGSPDFNDGTYDVPFCDEYECSDCGSNFKSDPNMAFCRECGKRCEESDCTFSYGPTLTTADDTRQFYQCRERVRRLDAGVLISWKPGSRQMQTPDFDSFERMQEYYAFQEKVEPTFEELMEVKIKGEMLPHERKSQELK